MFHGANRRMFSVAAIDPDPKRRTAAIPSLDGWRAVAVLLVVLGHAKLIQGDLAFFGVTVFFFLSGYLITTLMMREAAETGTVHLGRFWLRRFLRLTPPLVVTVLLAYAGAAMGWIAGGTGAWGFASLLGYFHNYYVLAVQSGDSVPLGLGVYWSLAVEQHFYLVLPLLFLLFHDRERPAKMARIVAGLCAVVLFWRGWLTFGADVDFARVYFATDTRIDSILFGCLLALWKNPMVPIFAQGFALAKDRWILASGAVLILSFLVRWIPFRQSFQFTLQGLALMPLFLLSMRHPTSRWFAWLNHRWMKRIGDLSYTIYLVHCVVLFNLESRLPGRIALLAVSAMTIFVYAWCMERFVESPLRSLRRRLG